MAKISKALVIFGGKTTHPLRHVLKEGFHHCFVAILNEGYWIQVDTAVYGLDIRVVAGPNDDLKSIYEQNGYKVIETKSNIPKIWKFNPFYGNVRVDNCVGLVKSVLSLNSYALTPYSLYKELKK